MPSAAAAVQIVRLGDQDHHSAAEALRKHTIAIGQREERWTRQQACEPVGHRRGS